MDKLLLVCNWEGTCWGLPRGKVNEVRQGWRLREEGF
jgi:hypothetical protein